MKIKSKIFITDKPNRNGRIYPKDELQKAVDKFNLGPKFLTFGKYPPDPHTSMQKKAIGSVKLEYHEDEENGWVDAKMEIFNTPDGTVLKSLLIGDDKDMIVTLPVGTGTISNGNIVKDFNIESVSCALRGDVYLGSEKTLFAVQTINTLSNDNFFDNIEESMFVVEVDE